MKWEEMVKEFKDEWVLIDVKDVDENFIPREGRVIAHSKNKEDIYAKLLELKPRNFSIEYTGEIPENLAVVLFLALPGIVWVNPVRKFGWGFKSKSHSRYHISYPGHRGGAFFLTGERVEKRPRSPTGVGSYPRIGLVGAVS